MEQAGTAQTPACLGELWHALFENCPLGMATADIEGHCLVANSTFQRLLGYTEQELSARLLSGLIEETEPSTTGQLFTELTKKEAGDIQFDSHYRRQDGSWRWLKVRVSVVRETPIKPRSLLVLAEDITDARSTKETLHESEKRLRAILELNNSLASDLDLRQLFRSLAAGLRSLVQYDVLALSLPNAETREMRIYSTQFAEGKGFVDERNVDPAEGSVAGRVMQTGKPILYNGIPAWANSMTKNFLEREGLKSGCAVPLVRGDNILGALSLACFEENAFTDRDVDLLMQVANQAAIAVENALRFRRLNESRKRLAGERLYLEDEIRRERDLDEIVGQSHGLRQVLEQVETVAATDAAVLILGETGTGKELIARAIHKRSSRRSHTLVRADCASIPAGLLESELFGHEKGAFTGAVARNIGRIELANKGTLFLDEVGDIPLELQSKLLRVLQEGEFERLGSTRTIRADFRVVAATNRDLLQMVERGEFRRDLYYRLNVFPIQLPPLRERADDIPLLAWHFVRKYARRMNKQIEKIRPEDMDTLIHYSWPGNVRELQNVIERSVVGSSHGVLELAPVVELERTQERTSTEASTLAAAEREHILKALQETDWVIAGPHGAARRLGVRRTTLLYKMRRLGIFRPTS
jgi:formate hydrogenlyase transcriptional activator